MDNLEQATKLTIIDEAGQDFMTFQNVNVVSGNSEEEEYKVTGEITIKQFILFSLWNLSKSSTESEEAKQSAEEASAIVNSLVQKIWIDSSNEGKLPSIRYDLIDLSKVDIEIKQGESHVDVPDRANLPEYFKFFHTLVQSKLQTEPVASILASFLRSYVEESKPKKTPKQRTSRKSQLAAPGAELATGNLKVALHAVRQTFGDQKDRPSFDKEKLAIWERQFGTPINTPIDRYGIDLTDTQHKVMEGILKGLSQTNYQGNMPPKTKTELLGDFGKPLSEGKQLPRIYSNIEEIPRIRVQQRELMRLCGVDEDNQAEYTRVLEALNYLSVTQFCFYYTRLAHDERGLPLKIERTGDYKKEAVEAVDTLFKVKTVRDDVTEEFKFYEIEPSPIFLDQHSRYYLLIPYGWREEVKRVVGTKKISSYTMSFLLYLRYQFEERRRRNTATKKVGGKQIPYEIRSSWVDIAIALKMPESVYKGKKDRAIKIIDEAYHVATSLGYLTSHKREGNIDVLTFNPTKYPTPQETIELDPESPKKSKISTKQ